MPKNGTYIYLRITPSAFSQPFDEKRAKNICRQFGPYELWVKLLGMPMSSGLCVNMLLSDPKRFETLFTEFIKRAIEAGIPPYDIRSSTALKAWRRYLREGVKAPS